jgi:DNA polymerase type B, organellar and viral
VVDASAFYVGVMQHFRLPYMLLNGVKPPTIEMLIGKHPGIYCIAKCRVDSPDTAWLVSVRGKSVWATGKLELWLHSPELSRAVDLCEQVAVHGAYVYQSGLILREFGQAMWEARRRAKDSRNEPIETAVKLIANALPGKFGAKSSRWIDCPHTVPVSPTTTWTSYDLETRQHVEYRSIGWRVQRHDTGSHLQLDTDSDCTPPLSDADTIARETQTSCPQIAAAITAHGRELMRDMITVAGEDNVYYCDTDCLHLSASGRRNIDSFVKAVAGGAGDLIDVETANEAIYMGPRHYCLDGRWTVAGLKGSATPVGGSRYVQEQLPGWSTMLSRGLPEIIKAELVEIDRSECHAGGTVDSDGRVTPVRLEMW